MMFESHGLIASIIIGFIVGAIAKLIVGGREPSGCFITILIGWVGSFIGGILGMLIFGHNYVAHWIGSIIGACILLVLWHRLSGGGRNGPVA